MKKILCYVYLICISMAGALTSCGDIHKPDVHILQIDGVSWACNVSTSYAFFGSRAETEEAKNIVLSASDGDLLYMLRDDYQFYYRYSIKDGTQLVVSIDTLHATSFFLNGILSYMELDSERSMEAFSNLSDPELEQLSSLYVKSSLTKDLHSTLVQKEIPLEGKGLILEGGSRMQNLNELLSILRPAFLVLDDSWQLPGPDESLCLANLELLWVEGNVPALAKLVNCCSNLESLIVAGWDPLEGELLPLSELTKLKSLTLAESKLPSLSFVELPEALRNLYIVSCDTLSDISSISTNNNLDRLTLTLCESIHALDLLQVNNTLRHLSLPPLVSQEDLEHITGLFTQLEVLELIDCSKIESLSPLKSLAELKILSLQLKKDQMHSLDAVEQAELVVLSSEVFDDNPEWIRELRSSLPDTKIVPGSGLCVGSGWFLLLLPFILIIRHVSRFKG